tara:strand:+ start:462 stop:1142 length:681 start_codon:yes stop_codon:yes gene_type:complete
LFHGHINQADPLKIQLDKGVHKIVGDQYGCMNVTCSHITLVGKGKTQTTVRGGFLVFNKQNVTFEELAVTNPRARGTGLYLRGSETNVDVVKCTVKKCGGTGMSVVRGATATATQCEFTESGNGVFCYRANTTARLNDCKIHHNAWYGLKACHAVVDLYGTKTDIHSNNSRGIWATDRGKVNIHLPAQHNTSHDNVRSNRYQHSGGSIANHNADGTFTHAVVDDGL